MHLPKFQFSSIILNFWVPFLTSCWLLPEHLSSDHWDVLGCPSRDHNAANCLAAPALYFHTPTPPRGILSARLYLPFPYDSAGKESACSAGDLGSTPELRRSPGEGNGNPLQYSCLENPMNRGASRATVHGVSRVRHSLVTKPPPPPWQGCHNDKLQIWKLKGLP